MTERVQGINTRVEILENGVTVALIHDPLSKVVATCIGIKYGSVYEPSDKNGIAHRLEHLLFKGTPERTDFEIWKTLRKYGINDDAETGMEDTRYYFDTERMYFSKTFSVLSDMIRNASIPEDAVAAEERVVDIEKLTWEQRIGDTASEQLLDIMFEGTPIKTVIGTEESLGSITRNDLVEAYKNYYTPDNSIVIVCGPLRQSDALRVVKNNLGDWTGTANTANVTPIFNIQRENREFVVNSADAKMPMFRIGFETLPVSLSKSKKEHMALEILKNEIMFRIQDNLRLGDNNGMVYHPVVENMYGKYFGLFSIALDTHPKAELEKVRELLFKEIRRTFEGKIKKSELVEARDWLTVRKYLRQENDHPIDIVYNSCNHYIATGSPRYTEEFVKGVKNISPEYMIDVAYRFLNPDKAVTLTILPVK